MENRTMKKAREAGTTAVKMTRPKSLEEIMKSFHDCRDCKHCIQGRTRWFCEISFDEPGNEIIMFKHHYITPCEKFTQKQ